MPVCMQPWMRFFHEWMQWRILTVLIQIQTAWWSRKTGGGSAVVSNVHPEVASNFKGRKATAEKRDTHQPHDLYPYCILLQHFWHLVATVHLGGASIVLRVVMKALERLKICTWTWIRGPMLGWSQQKSKASGHRKLRISHDSFISFMLSCFFSCFLDPADSKSRISRSLTY